MTRRSRPVRRRRDLRVVAPLAAVLLLLAGATALLTTLPAVAPQRQAATAATSEVGGPFTLVDQDGRTVTEQDFRGKWLMIYFGYTHCPDACPLALNEMAQALDDLGAPRRDLVQPIFVTVDPERDTTAVMKDYVNAFPDAHMVGLTGTQAQVDQVVKAYRIHVKKLEKDEYGEYAVDHTSMIHVMDPDGHLAGLAYHTLPPQLLASKISAFMQKYDAEARGEAPRRAAVARSSAGR
jgi:protein SCO1/2